MLSECRYCPSKEGPPKSLFGYSVLGVLGSGAGSTIYVVTDPKNGQIYTLKHVIVKNEKDARFVEQLETELEVGLLLNHHGLRYSLELRYERTLLRKITSAALILEFFDGVPLDRMVVASVPATVDCFIQTASALRYLHHVGYVHCDLKPINILLGGQEQVKVIDLGQACRIGTKKPRIQGTPDFIAPEQVRCEPLTAATDVFNLGATLYWVLTGQNIPTLFTLERKPNSFLLDAHIPSPDSLREGVPPTLSSLVMECLRTNAAKRPDMGEVARRLEAIQFTLSRQAVA